ncbi:MAG: squalene--hopene cyclase [Gammaproteobacteria bacterium]
MNRQALKAARLFDEQTAPEPTPRAQRPDALGESVSRALGALLVDQHPEGYWCYELEADCTIPSEYILMMHFMDEIDTALEQKLAVYIRQRQAEHGGWPLYQGGAFDLSCSVKAYYALKLAGDSIQASHMARAREAILQRGGAARANVFTRIALALFGQLPWRGVPFVPVEIVLLPRWFFFHLSKVSYWSRTVMVPLSILCSLKAKARNPRDVHVPELFTMPPDQERNYFPVRSALNRVFLLLERTARRLEHLMPRGVRRRAMQRAEQWVVARLNGTDGLGAIFPAMVNAYEALALLGYAADHPYRVMSGEALRRLLVSQSELAYCQPCVSPVWDTAIACCGVQEAAQLTDPVAAGLDWLASRQLLDEPGDWREKRPALKGGGWAFQFGNGHYPDLDDTAMVGWAMARCGTTRYGNRIERAAAWTSGMQSSNGGFASFDVDNTFTYLNELPFADHGALLDPPTSDVTARCVLFLKLADPVQYAGSIARGLQFLRNEQEPEGCWFGRWGTNYIYGTWSVLVALEVLGEPADAPYIQRAVEWLKAVQRADGGWGESNDSYAERALMGTAGRSTAFQTAWALLGLMAAGEVASRAVYRGIEYLQMTQQVDGLWHSDEFTAPGFPRVFYLKYHGYTKYFPLWALARYQRLRASRH